MSKTHKMKRPWGEYQKFFQEQGVWVKKVAIKPGARISLQKHSKRSEKWIVVRGKGVAIVNGKRFLIKPGSVVDVPLKAVHRIGNTGQGTLVFIEVACGRFLSEKDIVRFQDDYER